MLDLSGLDPRSDAYAMTVVQRLLDHAQAVGASDVHLTQRAGKVLVRLRVHGRLIDGGEIAEGETTSVVARIKALAGLVTYRRHVPQEGRLVDRQRGLDARVVTLPTVAGERVAIRIATQTAQPWRIDDLGLPQDVVDRLRNALQMRSGVILICGAAGSGKTTTAYACLRSLQEASHRRSIVTLEDPVEQIVPGVDHAQIEVESGFTWSAGLRAVLRQDAEVLMIGEIRDAETARVIFQAAFTGHLVIATMHARSAVDALRRLLDFDLSPHHILACLELLLCQRLLPRRCRCVEGTSLSATLAETAAAEDDQPAGKTERGPDPDCPTCNGSGVAGRFLVAEALPPLEAALARSLVADADTRALQQACERAGMVTLDKRVAQAERDGILALDEPF